ncbi:DUF664 domain-containing protein [candidate division KSB1 bacterium]|nr:DUF664 domain-containing protein [candidate division KSB1 bacterium]NIR72226.1 DUF664 domain-containing protein [candidate division KSB1 bacterium]NIS25034.1 DUF664 domain-containing protein [candidate division KSB1 bacterium]NIT73021.1 DUF664 domain-containing protein [candidate division KSB1 bacterium]NIU28206.1 DUF664 domain-containing protein [candidate division KSB1 bacterium]
MALNETLLPEFDHEMANTRKTLERVPDEKLDWKPHKKSWSLRELATHIANLPSWTLHTINEDSIDIAPSEGQSQQVPPAKSRQELLERFDKNVADARSAIADTSDEHFLKSWTLKSGGESMFTMPRVAVLRSFIMSHSIHHRAQLGLYLRLNNVPVPAIYGPTADEESM